MPTAFADPIAPIKRFHFLRTALCETSTSMEQQPWLGLAALAATHSDGAPEAVAKAIRARIQEVAGSSCGCSGFDAPLRYLVAASLVQAGLPEGAFAAESKRISHVMESRIDGTDPAFTALSIAILCLRSPRGHIRQVDIDRMATIYALMKKRHWWITVPEDLPMAALLSGSTESARSVDADVERSYLGLVERGYKVGVPIHVAASMLSVLDDTQEQAFARFLGLAQAFDHAGIVLSQQPAALSLLCLLDHEPGFIAEQYRAVDAHLTSSGVAAEVGSAHILLTAGLTFLDVLPVDRHRTGDKSQSGRLRKHRVFREFLAGICAASALNLPARTTNDSDD